MTQQTKGQTVVFDEAKLGDEIARVWGAHGAHAEVYSMLLKQRDGLLEALERIVERDVSYFEGTVRLEFAHYGDATKAINDARAAISAVKEGK